MEKSAISIATITWARDAAEEQLLRTALTELAALNIPVFVCDGGSPENFLQFLRSIPGFTIVESNTKGLWPQVYASISAAYAAGTELLLYTEPDKTAFFKESLTRFVERVSADASTGVVLAARTQEAFNTFPAFQQTTETMINVATAEVVGKHLDYTYGPFLFTRHLVRQLDGLPVTIGWGWRPFVFGIASRLQLTVEAIAGEFYCPPYQREDNADERIYRLKQLAQSIDGTVLSYSFPLQP